MDETWAKQWEQVFGGSARDELTCLRPTSDGGYILGGFSQSGVSGNKTTANFGGRDFWLIKL